MINAGGPTRGELRRLSNGETPKSVVFVQCVGSRDAAQKRNFCSCVCCMYAMKNAMLIKEHYPDCEVSILYNDVRAYGKGYEEYFERAKNMGVSFIRSFAGNVQKTNDRLVLPIENSYAGDVSQVMDLAFFGTLHVNGIYDIEVNQNLLVKPGTSFSQIKTVISHPQALAQCDAYIKEHGFAQTPFENTALAAQHVAKLKKYRYRITVQKK